MKFDVELVRNCLLKEGEVYTVRGYKSKDRYAVVEVEGIDYLRERICKIEKIGDLKEFVSLSGFSHSTAVSYTHLRAHET